MTLIGGEPTVRQDLLHLIRSAKTQKPDNKISIGTNGQRLEEIKFVKELKDSGLDFVFLVTICAVKPFRAYYPVIQISVSDIVKYLGKADEITKGTTPFNCFARLKGKTS